MAKRRRLDPVDPGKLTESPPAPAGPLTRAPIAEVAGEAAKVAAFDTLAGELTAARSEGRLVLALPLDEIQTDYLIRDRLAFDAEEMESLTESLRARGQQTPVEVIDRGEGTRQTPRYGLISGLRRFRALSTLAAEDPDRFGTIKALIRQPDSAADAYLAMVEENEVRAGLSFYEKAHLGVAAAEAGIYPDARGAIAALFASAPKAKRSKINSFVTLVEVLGRRLRFPGDIPEHLGLKLVKAIRTDAAFGYGLSNDLSLHPARTAAEERSRLEAALKGQGVKTPAAKAPESGTKPGSGAVPPQEVAPGIRLSRSKSGGEVRLTGQGVTPALIAALEAWLVKRAE